MNRETVNTLWYKASVCLATILISLSCRGGWSPNTVWGNATNGVCVGIDISLNGIGQGHPPLCVLYIKNISTNEISLRLQKPPERFYKIELQGPDGETIALRTNKQQVSTFDGVVRLVFDKNVTNRQADYFFVPDTFEIKTNGQYQLVVSLMATTNLWWNPPMRVEVEPNGRYKNIPLPTTNTSTSDKYIEYFAGPN